MTAVWTAVGAVALVNFVIKASGPVVLAGRKLPPATARVVSMLAPALLAALVVVDTASHGQALAADARLGGLAAAAVALVLRAPLVLVLVVAPAATAGARAAGWG
jgi:branched-subunit amino acid transport protein